MKISFGILLIAGIYFGVQASNNELRYIDVSYNSQINAIIASTICSSGSTTVATTVWKYLKTGLITSGASSFDVKGTKFLELPSEPSCEIVAQLKAKIFEYEESMKAIEHNCVDVD